MQPSHAIVFTPRKVNSKQFFFLLCVHNGGQKEGGIKNYASNSTALNHAPRNSHSCECISPLRVSNQSKHNLRKSTQRSWQQLCEHANIHRTGLFLSLSLSPVMQSLGQSCLPIQSLWITQVEWPTYASMIHTLWWKCVGVRGLSRSPFMVALHLVDLLYDVLVEASVAVSVRVDVRRGLGHLRVQALLGLSSFPLWFNAAVRPLWQQG